MNELTGRAGEGPHATEASSALWSLAFLTWLVHAAVNIHGVLMNATSGAEMIGESIRALVGSLVGPLIVVGIASFWESNRTERTTVKVFFVTSLLLLTFTLGGRLVVWTAHGLPGGM